MITFSVTSQSPRARCPPLAQGSRKSLGSWTLSALGDDTVGAAGVKDATGDTGTPERHIVVTCSIPDGHDTLTGVEKFV